MSREQLLRTLRRYLDDERVLAAMRAVPRDLFVPHELASDAWDNVPLPIGCGQTISQPLVVARMCELLELSESDRVLDVGTGSGYHAAVLARLAGHVWSVERHAELSRQAAANLAAAGVDNVTLRGRRRDRGAARRGAVRRDQRRRRGRRRPAGAGGAARARAAGWSRRSTTATSGSCWSAATTASSSARRSSGCASCR